MIVPTPLKWVGSKSKVMTELKKFLPAGQRLVEPFGGSCAVMMATDYPAYLVADINSDLINMYQQIQQHENAFIALAAKLFAQYTTEADYYTLRTEFNNEPGMTLLYRAAVFLYMNRHGHRGMCRYNRNGDFNIPFGHYKKPYFPLEEIRAFAEKAKRATFICAEFPKTLRMVKPGDVVYSDPPYEGTFSDYHTEGFDLSMQAQLASLLERAAKISPVIASNSDTARTRCLYALFDTTTINAPRSLGFAAGEGKKASEIIATLYPEHWIGFDPAAGDDSTVVQEVLS